MELHQLESELGQQLLDRSGRSVRLAEVGSAVLPSARAALDAVVAPATRPSAPPPGSRRGIVFEASALPMVVELAGRGLGLAVVPASIPNGPGILRITDPRLRSRLELVWPSAPAANPAARTLIEQVRALGPPGRSAP
jgi:DNA-binding transcriptional LysR family regulator